MRHINISPLDVPHQRFNINGRLLGSDEIVSVSDLKIPRGIFHSFINWVVCYDEERRVWDGHFP